MTNLVEQTGMDYFSSRFAGCIFVGPNDNPHIIAGIMSRDGNVDCKEVETRKQTRNIKLPYDFFQSFKFLKVPELGWRVSEDGRVAVFLRRKNTSYTRGVTTKNVERFYAPHTQFMLGSGKVKRSDVEMPSYLAMQVTKPEYMPFREGIAAMNNGEILCFASGPNLLVLPESSEKYNVIFNSQHVASVTPEGELIAQPESVDFDMELINE